jgi:ABC-type nitrate/sulfonate/bicarbonate transport system permease component
MNLVQIAVFAFFVKRVHDCGAAGWVGASAQAFGWTLLSGFLALFFTMFVGFALAMLARRVVERVVETSFKAKKPVPPLAASVAAELMPLAFFNPGPRVKFVGAFVLIVVQVLLLLRFTRCA